MGTPDEWIVSRVCEEFHCTPSVAREEIDADVDNQLFKIIEMRAYEKAKQAFDEGQKEPDVQKRPSGPLIDKVRGIFWELNQEKLKAKGTIQ